MRYRIAHYYGQTPPVPEATPRLETLEQGPVVFEVEIDDLHAFAEKHGNIILSPPGQTPVEGEWFIWVTDKSGKFKQKG